MSSPSQTLKTPKAVAGQKAAAGKTAVGGAKVRLGSPVYNRVHEFLIDEAALLDDNLFSEWLECVATDIRYSVPVRITRMSHDRQPEIEPGGTQFMNDDYEGLKLRVRRLVDTRSAWAEDPRSRTRRFITNVAVWRTAQEGEYAVRSYVLLARNRSDSPTYSWITAVRYDVVRFTGEDEVKLARRQTVLDTSVLGMSNLGVFV